MVSSDSIPSFHREVHPPWPRRPAPGPAHGRRPDSRGSVRPRARHEVLQPRRSAAKTYVAKALSAAAEPAGSTIDPVAALAEALSALDRAAKVGAIHPNAAARRKSRLTRKVNAALGGERVQTGGRVVKTTGKAAAAKAAKARIAAGKAGKAKGAQTAAGKARAALSKTARAEAAAAKAAAASSAATETAPAKATATKAAAAKARTTKAAPKKAAATTKAAPKTAPGPRPSPRPRRRRPRPRSRAQAWPQATTALVSPGRLNSGRQVRTGAEPVVSAATSWLRPEDPVQGGAAEAPERGDDQDRAGGPELLVPVEARERALVGHACRHEVRAAPGLQVALVDAVGARLARHLQSALVDGDRTALAGVAGSHRPRRRRSLDLNSSKTAAVRPVTSPANRP